MQVSQCQAFRKCSDDGLWAGRRPNETSPVGWTNYTPCFPAEVQRLLSMVYDTDEKKTQSKFDVALVTRNIELVGFAVSLIALTISLVIFMQFRSLRNTRTKIHRSLFAAMILQVTIRLILYVDQAFTRSFNDTMGEHVVRGIENLMCVPWYRRRYRRLTPILLEEAHIFQPYLCKLCYILLEYGISVMFMWMLVEGLYLHQLVTANSLRGEIPFRYYYFIGWGTPFISTIAWTILNALYYNKRDSSEFCWYGYNFNAFYWILQGPRLAVILVNVLFLISILHVLVVKLRHSTTSEVERVRKAVRAACVLLPLLGITNALTMIENYASTHEPWVFQLWSYLTHFLRSFQGSFIAIIYCFLNNEVRQVLAKHYRNYKAMKSDAKRQRKTAREEFMTPIRAPYDNAECSCDNRLWIPLHEMGCLSSRTNQPSGSQSGVELTEPAPPENVVFEELQFGYDRRRDPERNFELVTI